MRLIVIGAFVVLALWVLISGLANKKQVSVVLIIIFLIPAGVLGYFEYKWHTEVEEIGVSVVEAISEVKGTRLDCERLVFALVDVWVSEKTTDAGEGTVGIKYGTCATILNYYRQGEIKTIPTLEDLEAFQVLSAESVRLAGRSDKENEIQCLGIVNLPMVIEGLGGTADQGVYGYRLYVQEVLAKDAELRQTCKL